MSEVHRFSFEGLPLRGVLLRLSDAWTEILRRHAAGRSVPAYPAPVQDLLGEMTAAATLMHLNLRYPGSLTLQIVGDGPVQLAVVKVQPDLGLRATATVIGYVIAGASLNSLVNRHGQGQCIVTLSQPSSAPSQSGYQNTVAFSGSRQQEFDTLSEVLKHSMQQSGQRGATLILAANDQVAAGLLIQSLPLVGVDHPTGGDASHARQAEIDLNEHCRRIAILASSLKREELLTLPGERILHRLFWQEKLLHLTPSEPELAPHFSCTCSHDRVRTMILALGPAEAQRLVAELGKIEVGCDFCGAKYRFDSGDLTQIFSHAGKPPPTRTPARRAG